MCPCFRYWTISKCIKWPWTCTKAKFFLEKVMVCRFFILWYRSADSNGIKCENKRRSYQCFPIFSNLFLPNWPWDKLSKWLFGRFKNTWSRNQVSLISGYILVLEGYHNSHWIMKRIKMLCFLFNLFKDDENVILITTS